MPVDVRQINDIVSVSGLSSFIFWAGSAPREECFAVLDVVTLVVHRARCGPAPPIYVHGRELTVEACVKEGCARCDTGRGGYGFLWISSKWTKSCWIPLPGEVREVFWQRWGAGSDWIAVAPEATMLG